LSLAQVFPSPSAKKKKYKLCPWPGFPWSCRGKISSPGSGTEFFPWWLDFFSCPAQNGLWIGITRLTLRHENNNKYLKLPRLKMFFTLTKFLPKKKLTSVLFWVYYIFILKGSQVKKALGSGPSVAG
jgi:hypothetical protein